jgi:adenylate kinase family enzyme
MRISIIGNAGSGKTYLAQKIHAITKIKLYHLDQFAWKKNWEKVSPEVFSKKHTYLCNKKQFIIEGIYLKYLEERVTKSDVIIFLDIPILQCIINVIKRGILFHKKSISGTPQQCKQNIFTIKFINFLFWIMNFNKKHKQNITNIINNYKKEKKIYIIKSYSEINTVIKEIETVYSNIIKKDRNE